MRKYAALTTLVIACQFLAPGRAAAQHRHPHSGSLAVGFDVGFYIPDEDLQPGFTTQGLVEFYLTHNISLRGSGGWGRTKFKVADDLFLEQARGTLNLVINWERELWHPFITAGVGYYAIRGYRDDLAGQGWAHRGGINVGGGVEYFSRPTVTLKFEGTYHWVDTEDPRGFSLTAGLKKYF